MHVCSICILDAFTMNKFIYILICSHWFDDDKYVYVYVTYTNLHNIDKHLKIIIHFLWKLNQNTYEWIWYIYMYMYINSIFSGCWWHERKSVEYFYSFVIMYVTSLFPSLLFTEEDETNQEKERNDEQTVCMWMSVTYRHRAFAYSAY